MAPIPHFHFLQYVHPWSGWVADWIQNQDTCTRYRKATFVFEVYRGTPDHYIETIVWNLVKGSGVAATPVRTVSGPSFANGADKAWWRASGCGQPNGVPVTIDSSASTNNRYTEEWSLTCGSLIRGYNSIHLEDPYTLEDWQGEMFGLVSAYGPADLPAPTTTSMIRVATLTPDLTPQISGNFPFFFSSDRELCALKVYRQQIPSNIEYTPINGQHSQNTALIAPNVTSLTVTIGRALYYGPYCLTNPRFTPSGRCSHIPGAWPTTALAGNVPGLISPPHRVTHVGTARSDFNRNYPLQQPPTCAQKIQTCQTHLAPVPDPLPTSRLDFPHVEFFDKPATPADITMNSTFLFEHYLTGQGYPTPSSPIVPGCTSCAGLESNLAP